jgi:hypothetical protein
MSPWLREVTYGNPNDIYLPYLKDDGGYDFLYESLKDNPFPPNDSEATKDEIRELLNYQNSDIQKHENIVFRFMAYDEDLIATLKKYCIEKIGHNEDELIDDLVESTKSLLIKLKFYYQRPRPYQLAQYHKAKLFPTASMSALNPSYPSGHTFQAKLVCEVLGNKYVEHNDYLQKLAHDVELSRLYLGLHFQSDNDFALIVAKKVISSKPFTTKYGI